jgi:hypothetical protein
LNKYLVPFTGALAASIAAESLPTAREHIPVPDHSRVADEPPHTENDAKVKLFSNALVQITSTVTVSGGAFTLADGSMIVTSPPPPPFKFVVWPPAPTKT